MKTFTFPFLLTWISHLLGMRKTTGSVQSDERIQFTDLNLKRMERISKTITLNEDLVAKLEQIQTPQTWLVITEAWCGDSAQILPFIHKMSEVNSNNISLEIILRDDNMEVMNRYQTNGVNAIPKFICRNETDEDIFVWGPRPAEAAALHEAWKTNPNSRTKEDFELELHTWYANDKGNAIQNEWMNIL
jgi:hypothetical protein